MWRAYVCDDKGWKTEKKPNKSFLSCSTQATRSLYYLSVALIADFTAKGFHRTMDVGVLLQTRTCCKSFAALGAGVTASPNMMCTNVTLQIAGISEHLTTTTFLSDDEKNPNCQKKK
jgi:hypothetical protein